MNERIKELVNQCRGDPMTSEFEPYFDKEKFAELIVGECIDICNDTNDASYLNGVIAGRKIKKHFGVKE